MAEIPAGYYSSLNGKTDGDLKTAVHNIIKSSCFSRSSPRVPKDRGG